MKWLMRALKRMNEALPDLILTIIGYGLVVFGIGMLFSRDRVRFAVGLAVGIALAVFMAVHIASVLNDAVLIQGASPHRLAVKSVLRYAVVAVVLFVMTWLDLGDFIAAFIGLMGLKVSAYIQQFRRKG